MAEYVQKLRAGVRIAQPGRDPVDGVVMLSPGTRFHGGPETLIERLNSGDRMIPFIRAADEITVLVSRLDIEWVLASRGVLPELVCRSTFMVTREERMLVRFKSGGTMTGLLQMELPEHMNRASDFLNGADDYFPLVTEGGVALINKHQMLEAELYERSPLPEGYDPTGDRLGAGHTEP